MFQKYQNFSPTDWCPRYPCVSADVEKRVHGFQRQLERAIAGTPVSWKKKRSQNKFQWNTHSWNISQLGKMLDLTPIEKVSIVLCKSFWWKLQK